MKRILILLAMTGLVFGLAIWIKPDLAEKLGLVRNDAQRISEAWKRRQSNLIVEVKGRVILVLPDQVDVLGNFQKFRIELDNGHTVLVSHDLALAQAVPVVVGSEVRLRGEYDWDDRGGLIHWTHRDPDGAREGGWIQYMGKLYH